MKFRQLNKWENKENLCDLIYFAQLLEELLFDYSLDTYKPSAMNSSVLCIEAMNTLNEIEKGSLQKANLNHVTKELTINISKDIVAKSLLSLDIDRITSILNNKSAPLSEIKILLELMWSEIRLDKYKKRNEELISKAIIEDKGKDQIRSLTRSYITTLRNFGYSSKFLYEKTLAFFYYSDEAINSKDDVKKYLQLFDIEPKKYTAIYRASTIFDSISDSCGQMKIIVTKEQDDHAPIIKKHKFELRNENELHVVVNDIETLDIHSARLVADRRMELIGTMMTLFHHKKHPSWLSECLIIENESKESKFVHKPVNPMHKCIDHKEEKASKKLNELIHNFSMDHRSLPKFFRSAELHSLALNSDSHENQMINLWIALESLVPSSGEKAKIDNIATSVIPFLNLNYVNRLLQRLLSDIYNWNSKIIRETLRDIDGTDLRTKVFRLLVLDDYKDLQDNLNEKFRDFHLLRNRFYYLSNSLKTPKKIKKIIDNHTVRVDWQLRRIYRARNAIVHTGNTPSFTPILIENIHDYLDVVMSTLVNLASEGVEIDSIEQGFKYIELNYLTYIKKLAEAGDQFNNDNLDELMFKYSI